MNRYKYGRTYHFSWSPGVGGDDKIYPDLDWQDAFEYKDIVVTIKMDGENTCLYHDGYTHARSIDSANHVSRDWIKRFWGARSYKLPNGWRVYGENVYAQHSIPYNDLQSYFYAFAIYDEHNVRLDWDMFVEMCKELDICHVPVLHEDDPHNPEQTDHTIPNVMHLQQLFKQAVSDGHEGIVVTTYKGFDYEDMSKYLIKAVRKGHVQTDTHWMHKECIPNKLKDN